MNALLPCWCLRLLLVTGHDIEIGKYKRSPGWHRRLRAKRAKARLTIKEHRASKTGLHPGPRVLAAIKLLERHHSIPVYKETMYKGQDWTNQSQRWGPWSPQWPKGGKKANKKKEDGQKDKQVAGVLSPYESFRSGSSSAAASSSEQPEMSFFKEFVNFMKETKQELPENLQKLLPNEGKESIKEQQRRLNKHRNILNKISNKQRALEQDKERWNSWLVSVKEEIQKQKSKYEETQAKLSKEIAELQEEEKKIGQLEETNTEMEEEEQDVEDFLDDLILGKEEDKENQKLKEFQEQMEQKYQKQIQAEKERMQQVFSEQLRQLSGVNLDPYMDMTGAEPAKTGLIEVMEDQEHRETLTGLVRNAAAPFGVQRIPKTPHVSSPYGQKEKEAGKTKERPKMGEMMKTPDTGQKP